MDGQIDGTQMFNGWIRIGGKLVVHGWLLDGNLILTGSLIGGKLLADNSIN